VHIFYGPNKHNPFSGHRVYLCRFLCCYFPSNAKHSVLTLWTRGGQPVRDQQPHFLLCYRKDHITHVGTHAHHPISSSLKHVPLLSYIYCNNHTPTWQGQNLSDLLLCMLFSRTSSNYVRVAWNRAKSHMRLASRGLVTPALFYRMMVNSMKTSFAQKTIVATPLANHMK